MNSVNLVGRLAKDVTLTAGEKEGCVLTVAVQGYGDKVDFIPCSAWGKQAEYLDKYSHKGDLLSVSGRLTTYKDKDNNFKMGVVVNTVSVLSHAKPKDVENK